MSDDDLQHDPQEDDPKLGPIIRQAEQEAEAALANEPRDLGFCHLLWETQKKILRKKYRIRWKTPAEMNPDILFD
jgi:hypothetical protein